MEAPVTHSHTQSDHSAPHRVGRRSVVVLGMHRSGTSLTAHVVRDLGWHLGDPDQLLAAREDNLEGFFERADVQVLNDQLLEAMGAAWDAPPSTHELALLGSSSTERIAELVRGLSAEATGSEFAIKDPRLCLLWPLWEKSLPQDVASVLVFRDPLEVADSLRARDRLPVQLGLALWETYNIRMLQARAGQPVTVVRYADLLADPDVTVGLMAEGLDCQAGSDLSAVVHAELRHSRRQPAHEELLSPVQLDLWEWILRLPAGAQTLAADFLPIDVSSSAADLLIQRRELVAASRKAKSLTRQVAGREEDLREAVDRAAAFEKLLRHRHDELTQTKIRLVEADDQAKRDADTWKEERASLTTTVGAQVIEVNVLTARTRHLDGVLSRVRADGLLQEALSVTVERERDGLRDERDGLREERDGLLDMVEALRIRRLEQTQRLAALQAQGRAQAAEFEGSLLSVQRELADREFRLVEQAELQMVLEWRLRLTEFERANLLRAVEVVESQRRSSELTIAGVNASRVWRLGRWGTRPYRALREWFE